MTPTVATLSVDQVPVLERLAAFVAVGPSGWRGRLALPAGSPWLDPSITYQFHADGRSGDVRLTGPVPEVVAVPTSVTFVGCGPFTADA